VAAAAVSRSFPAATVNVTGGASGTTATSPTSTADYGLVVGRGFRSPASPPGRFPARARPLPASANHRRQVTSTPFIAAEPRD
jgi:hypothetical protein